MLILQLGGMGSHQSKPNETSAQPGGSRTAQFLHDEGIPISKSPFIPPQLNGTSTATSPGPPNGRNLPWEHNDPSPGPPTQKRRPWRKPSVQGPLVGNISTPSLSPASPPLSTFSTGSDGLTPASSTFSRFSSASSVTSPPTSPLSSGSSVRRRPIGNDPFRHDLRPAASSPSLFAAASSPRPQRPQRPQRPPIPRANIPEVFPDHSSRSGLRPRQNSLDEQWPALQPANSPTMNSAPLRPQHAPSPSLTALWQSVSSGSYHMMTQEEQDRAIAQLLQESPLLLNPQAYGDNPARPPNAAPPPPPTAPPAVSQEELDRAYAERLQREEVEAANAQNASPPSPRPSSNGFRPSSRTPSSPRAGNDLYSNNPFRPDNPWSDPWSDQQSLNNNGDLYDEGPSSRRRPPTYASLQQVDEDMRIAIRIQEEEEAEVRRANAAPRTRECVVCGEATPIPDFPSLMNCAHEPQVCGDCYKTWISTQLDNKSWKEIGCPDSGCKELLGHADVQRYAAPEVYLKFDALSAREALNDDPNFRWCRRAGCKSGQIHENGTDGNIFRCIVCKFKVCTVHEDTWHEGETCEEYDYRTSGRKERDQKAQEEASLKAIGELTKKCPGRRGKCGWNIEKNDGCDHMTCTKCKHEFCWVCMAPYGPIREKGNASHRRNCKYHSDRIT